MKKNMLLLLTVASACFALPTTPESLQEKISSQASAAMNHLSSLISKAYKSATNPLNSVKQMLEEEDNNLNAAVIDKVMTTLKCAAEYHLEHNNILTIIDYSLPSSEKRLWVFDLKEKKLLFHTYVSHGLKSGTLLSSFFSNKYNSRASSIGVYKTEKAYYGREGLSLRLDGLDKNFNDNASGRSVVMHGGWYVEEDFIKKYGRAGRSWGCPALPLQEYQPIINAIKDNSLFVIYYPSDVWFAKSKFLNCDKQQNAPGDLAAENQAAAQENEAREAVLFASVGKNKNPEENGAVVAVTADNYERIFHLKPPLERMIRRTINNTEYIALSTKEFGTLVSNNRGIYDGKNDLSTVNFVVPTIKMRRGYYATEMHIVDLGKIKEIKDLQVYFESKPVLQLRPTDRFIRWLGL